MRDLPPLAAIRVFEAAARHLNFTQAAAELNMTQAAVSYQIRVLEQRLGTDLFRRIKRRVELTEAGARIAPALSRAFDLMDGAFASARSERDTMLTITCSQSFSSEWLAPKLGLFQMAHPDLAVRLLADDAIVDFAASDVDVAIRHSDLPWPGLVNHFLMRAAVAPFVSPGFLAEHPECTAPESIFDLPRISPDDIWWERWGSAFGLAKPPNRPGVRLDSQVMDANAAMAGHGIAILNPLMWPRAVARGALVRVGDIVKGPRNYWLTYPAYKRSSAKIVAFRSWLLAEMADAAKDDPDGLYQPPDQLEAT